MLGTSWNSTPGYRIYSGMQVPAAKKTALPEILVPDTLDRDHSLVVPSEKTCHRLVWILS